MKKYFYRTVYVIAYTRTENTQTIKHIMIIDFDSIMVNLVTVMLIWLHVNFDRLHGFPHTHWTFPGTGVNVSVKRHLKGQFSFILQLWFCCFVWFFSFICGCRDVWTMVWSHTPAEVMECDWSEPGLSRPCSLPTVTLPVVTGRLSHWSSSSVTQLS